MPRRMKMEDTAEWASVSVDDGHSSGWYDSNSGEKGRSAASRRIWRDLAIDDGLHRVNLIEALNDARCGGLKGVCCAS